MAEEPTFALPRVPQLLGEENIDEWKVAIRNHFKWYRIFNHLKSNVEAPSQADTKAFDKSKRDQLKGNIIITTSFSSKLVRQKLKNAGWDPDEDLTPKDLLGFVIKISTSITFGALCSLVPKFHHLDRAKYESLSKFQTRLTYQGKTRR